MFFETTRSGMPVRRWVLLGGIFGPVISLYEGSLQKCYVAFNGRFSMLLVGVILAQIN